MNRSTVANRWNLELIDDFYQRWQNDPDSVDATWQAFFEGYQLAQQGVPPGGQGVSGEASEAQAAVTRLITSYREIGHYLADLDPLGMACRTESRELLDISAFGLADADLDRTFHTRLTEPPLATLKELVGILQQTYCGTIGVEYMHIRNIPIRKWLQERMEPARNRPNFDARTKKRILWKLSQAELLEAFLHRSYVGQKRFSLEGGESLIPLLDAIVERSTTYSMREIVFGMAHRGRLNVLAHTLNKPYELIFSEFEGSFTEDVGDGDVKYHLGYSGEHMTAEGKSVHVTLTPNPSHLEAVNPVVEGRVRSKQNRANDPEGKVGLPVLIHGDAAFAGQGLVAETLCLSQLPGYRTGGTVHVVVNNQIGFTTNPGDSRSTKYCTDVAKMIEAPIFHVNADDPEAVVYVAELALDFRQTFGRDVVIDMVCYRKYGHNEADEPAFTQPVMYQNIRSRKSIREKYIEKLIAAGELTQAEADTVTETLNDRLQSAYDHVHNQPDAAASHRNRRGFAAHWTGLTKRYSHDPVPTGVAYDTLKKITDITSTFPEGFEVNPKVGRNLQARIGTIADKGNVDWAFGEMLAFGTLLLEGHAVRVSGQDSRRGTFSHRHSTLFDPRTGSEHVPLNHLAPGQAPFLAIDSLLSEAAVLGFEYGYSLDDPKSLVIWEAQFGDFANGAQVIIDQFITSAETKWGRSSGLVMLLPHGYEGQGPEHSSARLERYLQACAEDNVQVVYPTTPAQFFHLLRRQLHRDFRKPLIVMTPKSLLRHKMAVSPVESLVNGHFQEVIDDATTAPEKVKRVVLCSGKVYYDLLAKREEEEKAAEVAILRLEQFYPWPADALKSALARYKNATLYVWAQEESHNMGGWSFVEPRLLELTGESFKYAGRDASASPATGSHHIHGREQAELVEAAIVGTPHLVTAKPAKPAVALTSKE